MSLQAGKGTGLFPLYIIIILIFSLVFFIPATGQADQEEQRAAELKQLQQRISRLRKKLQTIQHKRNRVKNELRRTEKSISRINRKLRRLRKQIREQQYTLNTLYKERTKLKASLQKHRKMLGSQVRASYVMGRQEQLKIVLNQGDPATLARALVYFDYLNRSRTRQIKDVVYELNRLRQVEADINKEKQILESLRTQQAEKKKALVKKRKVRKRILNALKRELETKGKKLGRLLQNEQQLQRILNAVGRVLADIPDKGLQEKPFASRKGQLNWPTAGRIRYRFGSRRSIGKLRWKGVVIQAASGNEVRAVARGRVAFADWIRGYGLIIILDHGDGYMSLYGHNQSLFKEIGEWVEEGETIASVGNSGGQSQSNLYFELRFKGKPVNPAKWCKRTRSNFVGLNGS